MENVSIYESINGNLLTHFFLTNYFIYFFLLSAYLPFLSLCLQLATFLSVALLYLML